MQSTRGYTLLELMITIAILGIVLALAVPSMIDFVRNQRLTSGVNDIVLALNSARLGALTRQLPVSVCPSTDGTVCGGTWTDGAIVFHDDNGNGTVDAGDEVRQFFNQFDDSMAIALPDFLIYMPDGTPRTEASFTFPIQSDVTVTNAPQYNIRRITIAATGRVQATKVY